MKFLQFFKYPKSPLFVFSLEKEDSKVKGEYKKLVDSIRKKYYSLDSKGSLLTRLIIDYRASVIAGGEFSISGDEKTVLELNNWIEKFGIQKKLLEYTQLVEREGRLALVLYKIDDDVGIRSLPWHQYKYQLIYDEYDRIKAIKYDSGAGEVLIEKPYLCYMQYSGQEEYSNETIAPPKVAYCLEDIEAIDDELSRWSKINHYFADPTPHFDTEEENFFDALKKLLKSKKAEGSYEGSSLNLDEEESSTRRWKIGEGIVTYRTKLQYVQSEMRGIESLDRVIQVRCQRISALTGFPLYLLYPELMSNRATSHDISIESNSALVSEKRKIEELWTDVFRSYCAVSNKLFGTALNPTGIYTVIPQSNNNYVKSVVDLYLPLLQNKVISKRTLQELIPGIDPDIEQARVKEESENEYDFVSKSILNEVDL